MSNGSFNTNIAALSAARRLGSSTASLVRSFDRLSTGLRINRASDDAAGLAIADRLRVDSRIYQTASRNVNDALSVTNIMSGTLADQSNIIGRLLELAEQSANGTSSNTQRASMQKEYNTLIEEFGRLGDTTSFNGQSLLLAGKGSNATQLKFQAGIDGSNNSQLVFDSVNTGTLSGVVDLASSASGLMSSRTLDELVSDVGPLVSTYVIDNRGIRRDILLSFEFTSTSGSSDTDYNILAWQRVSDTGGVGASTGGGGVVDSTSDDWVFGQITAGSTTINSITGSVVAGSNQSLSLSFGGGATATLSVDLSGLKFANATSLTPPAQRFRGEASTLHLTGVETKARALAAMSVLRKRLADLGQYQGQIGAIQSRLETTASLTTSNRVQNDSAESRIRDVDIAEEAANLVRSTILQQAGASILASANQQPQLLLGLLR